MEDDGKIQGAEDTDGVLSGSTDVEQTCFKSKCNRKSGHNQGSGLSDFTSDSLRLYADAVWIEIKAPINAVLAEYSRLIQEGKVIVSFVSGDPFFFGFASTIRKNLLGVGMKVFPYFNSLQMFAHHEQIPYENMHAVSVTGRPWHELDRALLEYRPLIGVLTDRVHTPRAIAKRMMEYHLDRDYTMWIPVAIRN